MDCHQYVKPAGERVALPIQVRSASMHSGETGLRESVFQWTHGQRRKIGKSRVYIQHFAIDPFRWGTLATAYAVLLLGKSFFVGVVVRRAIGARRKATRCIANLLDYSAAQSVTDIDYINGGHRKNAENTKS